MDKMSSHKPANNGRRTRMAEVVRSRRLTPGMHRVTFGGEDMADFPAGQESAHIKLILPEPGQDRHEFESLIAEGNAKSFRRRTYTVRHHRPADNEMDVDFVVHEGGGPACDWALAAQPGSFLAMGGPGPKKAPHPAADWYLFGADLSAFPAAAAALEDLPADAVGKAIFEIPSEDDRQALDAPKEIDIHWHVHSDSHRISERQLAFFRDLEWPAGNAGVFAAGEGHAVKMLREHLLNERGMDKREMYLSSYWIIGLAEDEHQVQKRAENAAVAG